MGDRQVTFSHVAGSTPNRDSRVYFRAAWADPWVADSQFRADETVWSIAPTIPTATLVRRYGRIDTPSFGAIVTHARDLGKSRIYVKVERDTDDAAPDDVLRWYGVVFLTDDRLEGTFDDGVAVETGEQRFHAYGFEKLLADFQIQSFAWERSGAAVVVEGRPPAFNQGGTANRSGAKVGTYLFAEDTAAALFWSSQDVVEHLLTWATPDDELGNSDLPFGLHASATTLIPTWDQPTLSQEGQTTFGLLNRILDRRRLFNWFLEVDEADDTVRLHVNTTNDADLNAGPGIIPKNLDQVDVQFDRAPHAAGALKLTDVDRADQIVVLGDQIRVLGSFAQGKGNLVAGWSAGDQTVYNDGASGTITYPTLDRDQKMRRNAEVRATKPTVFSAWRLAPTWDRQAWDFIVDAPKPMFPANHADVWIPGLRIESTIPLADDSGDELPIQVWFQLPDEPARYVSAARMGSTGDVEQTNEDHNARFSCSVAVNRDGLSILLKVNGQPQHAIADPADRPSLPVDEFLGGWNVKNAVWTFSLRDQQRARGVFPAIPAAGEFARRLVIDAGDQFKRTYIVPGTVIGVDDEGKLVKHAGGFVRDDNAKLEAIAKVANSFFGATRRTMTLTTTEISGRLPLGALVDRIVADPANQDVKSVISQVRIVESWGDVGQNEASLMEVSTGYVELDALSIIPSAFNANPAQVGLQRPFPDRAFGGPFEAPDAAFTRGGPLQ